MQHVAETFYGVGVIKPIHVNNLYKYVCFDIFCVFYVKNILSKLSKLVYHSDLNEFNCIMYLISSLYLVNIIS